MATPLSVMDMAMGADSMATHTTMDITEDIMVATIIMAMVMEVMGIMIMVTINHIIRIRDLAIEQVQQVQTQAMDKSIEQPEEVAKQMRQICREKG